MIQFLIHEKADNVGVAAVDIKTGELTGERHRILTPQPATPDAVVDTVA